MGNNLLRLGRWQPRALGGERGLRPKVTNGAGRLGPWDNGGGHTLPCLRALPLRAPEALLQGRDAPASRAGGRGRGHLTLRWGPSSP